MNKSFNFVFLLAFPIIFGVLAVSKQFVPIFFGEGYEKVVILMNVISPILLMIGISNVIGTQYLLPTNRQKEYTISVIAGAIINFFINLVLIGRYGAIGASIGTVIAEVIVTVSRLYFIRKDFNIKKIIVKSKNYIISGIIMYLVCSSLEFIINNSIILLLFKVILGMITYIIVLIILKDNFIKEIKDKLVKSNITIK